MTFYCIRKSCVLSANGAVGTPHGRTGAAAADAADADAGKAPCKGGRVGAAQVRGDPAAPAAHEGRGHVAADGPHGV